MSDKCECCGGKKQHSFWDHLLNVPRHDQIKEQEKRMEKNYKLIMENSEKLQAAAKESDEALIRAIREL